MWNNRSRTLGIKGELKKNFLSFIRSRYHFNINSEKISEIGHGVTILWLLKVGNLGALLDTGLRSQEAWC